MATTLRDIARVAGVDIGTVSRALADSPRVAESTKARIAQLARELCYTPNYSAISLRNRSTRAISIVRFTVGMVEVHSEWLACLAEEARRLGYRVRLDQVDDFDSVLAEQSVDGFILPFSPRYLPSSVLRRERGVRPPLIFTDCEQTKMNAVWMDNRGGASEAVSHLYGLGHTRMAFFGEIEHAPVCVERVRGFRDALTRLKLDGEGAPVVPMPHWPMEVDEAMRFGESLMAYVCDGVTGIVAASDVAAIGAARVVSAMGHSVPGHVSIVGFDDTRLSRSCVPPITSLRQDFAAASVAALSLFQEALATGNPVPSVSVPMSLVVRGSTASCSPT